jgi:feruloyl esterase
VHVNPTKPAGGLPAAIAALLLCCGPIAAQVTSLPVSDETALAGRCQALLGAHADIPDAPTVVTAATLVAASAELPAYCQVLGTIKPNIGIELRLPASSWNRKFMEYGRGGYCRTITMGDCDTPLRKGYACVITDHGHQSTEPDDIWAHDNLQAQVDCGFRGTHVAAVAGKALTEFFYHRPPTHSFYMGCSTGGRLGMVEAQRFPWDFDGIIAGAAPITKSATGLSLMWNALAPLNSQGRQILAPADVRLLAAAVTAQCDSDDGLADDIVGAPLQCRFDPATLLCSTQRPVDCFNAAQVAAVRKFYQGPVISNGTHLYEGSVLPGSELNWIGSYVAQTDQRSYVYTSMNDLFRNINDPGRGANWQITDFNWEQDYKQLGIMEALNSGANPDLRKFKEAGGKLIVFHGLADELVTPGNMIDFYKTVQRTMGGYTATADFFRLFLVPGMNHCSGGTGATVIDYLAALEAWVERGQAPDKLIGAHLKASAAKGNESALPRAPTDIQFTRPHYAYPERAQYQGSGNPSDAANFKAVQ